MDESDPIPLSALQHWCYCPRQCALIYLEQVFAENLYTLRGQVVHRQVDQPGFGTRAGLRVERALPVWSDRLGLIGKCDVVEFEPDDTPYPVEYKVGSRAKAPWIAACDDLQLAAQAMCLEEMTGKPVAQGAIFYAKSKRRRAIAIDAALRRRVEQAAASVRALLDGAVLPAPSFDGRCEKCSLREICQPEAALSARGLFAADG